MRALLLSQLAGKTVSSISEISSEQLPEGDVLVDVDWSSLNYKDALAITGNGKIIRNFPMVPGIDFSGRVSRSNDKRFSEGQQVVLTGWGVGENHWGGLAEQARVKGDWLIHLPQGLTPRQAMIIGTAGFTAMLCVMALEDGGVLPDQGEVVVSGASGGVGSTAVMLLSTLGYDVVAISGRPNNKAYLEKLGAKRVLSREEFNQPGRPLDKQLWAGAIDCVGDQILSNLLAQTVYSGTVAACGLAGGHSLTTTVMPFILRNVRLQGVDSVTTPTHQRMKAWLRLAEILPASFYEQTATEITLDQVPETATQILANRVTGRTLVKVR